MSRRRLTWTIRKTLAAWLGLAALLVAQAAPLSFSADPARRASIELSRILGGSVLVCAADQDGDRGQSRSPHCVFCLPVGGHAPGLPAADTAVVPTPTAAIRLLPNPPVAAVRPSTAYSPFAPRAPPVPA